MSDVTLGCCAIAVPVMRHSRTNATSLVVMVASFVRRPRPPGPTLRSGTSRSPHRLCQRRHRWAGSFPGSGSCLRATEPFIETDAAEARFAQRHERALLDAAAEVSSLGV